MSTPILTNAGMKVVVNRSARIAIELNFFSKYVYNNDQKSPFVDISVVSKIIAGCLRKDFK